MENRFFSFISPVLKVIDNGKFFREPLRWLYFFLAVSLSLLLPVLIIVEFINMTVPPVDLFTIFGPVLVFLGVCFTSWVGFQIWWNRTGSIRFFSSEGDENFASTLLSHFIQTLGEWVGATVALNGFFYGLISLLQLLVRLVAGMGFDPFINNLPKTGILLHDFLPFWLIVGAGDLLLILIGPLSGFLIIVITRFLAEQIRALASVANYTRKLLKIQLRRIRVIEKNHWD